MLVSRCPPPGPSFMYGDTITFDATVTSGSGTPTGTVTFQVMDGPVLATVPLSSGSATYTTSSLPVGLMSVTASYNGDTDFDPAFCGWGEVWVSRAISYSHIYSVSGECLGGFLSIRRAGIHLWNGKLGCPGDTHRDHDVLRWDRFARYCGTLFRDARIRIGNIHHIVTEHGHSFHYCRIQRRYLLL